ncbi:MAG: ECF-type sigma factor [Phycisphaerales bacterium]
MTDGADHPITELFRAVQNGHPAAEAELIEMVYGQLRGIAQSAFARDGDRVRTLQPTAIVNEAWLKLAGDLGRYENRRHFFAVAATAMRHVIADAAKAKGREKRGGGAHQITLIEDATAARTDVDVAELDDALAKLAELNARHARIVELRFFGALTVDETAELLDVSPRTVAADWVMARTWLRRELGRDT